MASRFFALGALLLLPATRLALAEDKPLIDFDAAGVEARVSSQAGNAGADYKVVVGPNFKVLAVTIPASTGTFPGVAFKPEGDVWDLSAHGHVEARVQNTGTKPLRLTLRVDNAGDWHDNPWNAEMVDIAPGASGSVRVIFGYNYGYKPGFALKSDKVTRVLLFTGKADAEQSFRVESLTVGGAAGEKPESKLGTVSITPKGGVVLGPGAPIDVAKQATAAGGAQVAAAGKDGGQGLLVSFAASGGSQSMTLKPPAGRWNLRDATQVKVKMTNDGTTPIVAAVQLVSDSGPTDSVAAEVPAGQAREVVVPFAAAVPWKGGPTSADRSVVENVKGTGTNFVSNAVAAIMVSAKVREAGALRIESIIADAPPAETPDWLGKRPPVDGDWAVTFNEEFSGKTIDEAKWNLPNPYGDNWYAWSAKGTRLSKDQVLVGDGTARLRYEKKPGFKNDDPKLAHYDYSCGYLDTFDKFAQCYGYFESRMKIPTAAGLWPAFWLMPDRGRSFAEASGSRNKRCTTADGGMEFDIMEHLSIWGPHRYNIAMHWDGYGKEHKKLGTGKIYVQPDKEGYITTGMLWLPGEVVYYYNGKEVLRWKDARVSSVPSYIMFTLPQGGWDGNTLDGTGLPDDLVIKYVRVWQRHDLLPATTAPASTAPARP